MIPIFPEFTKISLGDRGIVESYVDSRVRPYSTFNFTNLWAWDIRAERMVSDFCGNLVVYLTDYKTSVPFLSFYGTNEVVRTALELLQFSERNGWDPALRFITEETVRNLNAPGLHIQEDRDNWDYIFPTSRIAEPKGRPYMTKRILAKRFVREHPDAVFELRDLRDSHTKNQIVSVVQRWKQNKEIHKKAYDLKDEEIALRRLMESADNHDLVLSCVSLHGKMIGFSIDEVLSHGHAMAHFIKADISFKGVYEFLNEKVAKHLIDQRVDFWNWQQDLSIKGLRELKMSYRPIYFLEKYKVSFDPQVV